jgi:hypothetical protein
MYTMDINRDYISNARRCAQLKQQIRLASCPHPQHALIIRLTTDDGYVEYCSDCNRVTDSYFPEHAPRIGNRPATT